MGRPSRSAWSCEMWISPRLDDLKETIAESSGGLVLCSPFIGGTALDIVAESLPDAVSSIEIWTKLDQRDYVTGATDPESLRSFVRTVRAHRPVRMRQASNLHAKIVLSNGPVALAGSANLTAGGYLRNLEAVSKVRDEELASLRKFASQLRIKLEPIGIARFERFVKECLAKMGEREALLALIREQGNSCPAWRRPPHPLSPRLRGLHPHTLQPDGPRLERHRGQWGRQ